MPPLLTLLVTTPAAFAAGVALHRLLYARVLAAGEAGGLEARSLLLSFGLLFVLQNGALLIWSADLKGYSYLATPVRLFGTVFPANRMVAAGVALAPLPGLLRLSPAEPRRQGGARPHAGARRRPPRGDRRRAPARPVLRRGHRDVGGHRLARQHALRAHALHGPALYGDRARGGDPGRARQCPGKPRRRPPPRARRDRRRLRHRLGHPRHRVLRRCCPSS